MLPLSLKTKLKVFTYRWTAIDLFTDEYEQFKKTSEYAAFAAEYGVGKVWDFSEGGLSGLEKAIYEIHIGAHRRPNIEYLLTDNPFVKVYYYFECNIKTFLFDLRNGFEIKEME